MNHTVLYSKKRFLDSSETLKKISLFKIFKIAATCMTLVFNSIEIQDVSRHKKKKGFELLQKQQFQNKYIRFSSKKPHFLPVLI